MFPFSRSKEKEMERHEMEIVMPDSLPEAARYSNMHRRRLEAAGKFPRRIRISKRRYGYDRAEINAWLAARIAEHQAASCSPKMEEPPG